MNYNHTKKTNQTTMIKTLALALICSVVGRTHAVAVTGYIVDTACVNNIKAFDTQISVLAEPEKHTLNCLTMQVCLNSGFQLIKDGASQYTFSDAQNTEIITFLAGQSSTGNTKTIGFTGTVDVDDSSSSVTGLCFESSEEIETCDGTRASGSADLTAVATVVAAAFAAALF